MFIEVTDENNDKVRIDPKDIKAYLEIPHFRSKTKLKVNFLYGGVDYIVVLEPIEEIDKLTEEAKRKEAKMLAEELSKIVFNTESHTHIKGAIK
jgi:hypothetical protein